MIDCDLEETKKFKSCNNEIMYMSLSYSFLHSTIGHVSSTKYPVSSEIIICSNGAQNTSCVCVC